MSVCATCGLPGHRYGRNEGIERHDPQACVNLLAAENERLRKAYEVTAHEVEQTLGRALSYPGYPDEDSETVCVGDHVPETLASEAATELVRYREENKRLWHKLNRLREQVRRIFRQFEDGRFLTVGALLRSEYEHAALDGDDR